MNSKPRASTPRDRRFTLDRKIERIIRCLKRHGYAGEDWISLGASLYLIDPELSAIAKNQEDDAQRFMKCLRRWLQRVDKLKIWDELIAALQDISQTTVVEAIEQDKSQALSILQSHKGLLSQSLVDQVPLVKLATLLRGEEIISEADLFTIESTQLLLSERATNLFTAIENAVHSNYINLELFASILHSVIGNLPVVESIQRACDEAFTDEWEFECTTLEAETTSPNAKSFRIHRGLSSEFRDLRKKLVCIFVNMFELIKRNSTPFTSVQQQMADCYSNLAPQLSTCRTVKEILELVLVRCSLLDIDLLQTLADLLRLDSEAIQDYGAISLEFRESVPLNRCFVETFEVVKRPVPLQYEIAMFVITNWDPDKVLQEILTNIISATFGELSKHLQITCIRESVEDSQFVNVYCVFPVSLTGVLVEKALKMVPLVKENGVSALFVGYITVWKDEVVKCDLSDVIQTIHEKLPHLKDILIKESNEATFIENLSRLDAVYKESRSCDEIVQRFLNELNLNQFRYKKHCRMFIHALKEIGGEARDIAFVLATLWGLQEQEEKHDTYMTPLYTEDKDHNKPSECLPGHELVHSHAEHACLKDTALFILPLSQEKSQSASMVTFDRLFELILDGDNSIPVNLVAVATDGLPACGKTTAMTSVIGQVLSSSELRGDVNDYCLSLYNLCILGGNYPFKNFHWTLNSKRNRIAYLMLYVLIRTAVLKNVDPFWLIFDRKETSDLFGNPQHNDDCIDQCNNHIKWVHKEVYELYSRVQNREPSLGFFQTGITLVTALDVGLSKALQNLLPYAASVCQRLFRLTFFSLERDTYHMDSVPDIDNSKYTNTHSQVMQSRSRLVYVLHHATAGYLPDKYREHRTILIGTTEEDATVVESEEGRILLKKAHDIVMKKAKELNIDQVFQEKPLYINVNNDQSLVNARHAIEEAVLRNPSFQTTVQLKWFFLRTLLSSDIDPSKETPVVLPKSMIIELARILKMSEDEVDMFLATFTEFGSLLFVPHLDPDYIIVDLQEFTNLLDKFYTDESVTKHGIMTRDVAMKHIPKQNLREIILRVLISYGLIAVVPRDTPGSLEELQLSYFLPSARISDSRVEEVASDDSIHVVILTPHIPLDSQVALTQQILQKPNAFLVPHESYSVTKIRLQSGPTESSDDIYIDIVYRGGTTELRICNTDPVLLASSFVIDMCSEFLNACNEGLTAEAHSKRGLKFNFGVLCCQEKGKYHSLLKQEEEEFCNVCQHKYKEVIKCNQYTSVENVKRQCWLKAIKKCNYWNAEESTLLSNKSTNRSTTIDKTQN